MPKCKEELVCTNIMGTVIINDKYRDNDTKYLVIQSMIICSTESNTRLALRPYHLSCF